MMAWRGGGGGVGGHFSRYLNFSKFCSVRTGPYQNQKVRQSSRPVDQSDKLKVYRQTVDQPEPFGDFFVSLVFRRRILYCVNGQYLEIADNGHVRGTSDKRSPYGNGEI